ncbi:hypothetical protein [Thermoflexus sp.]|uniref:hypothetical protein n=1 Tax=Thermoflexus sp. TaxID=1969742 RepID=UPI003C073D32
MRSRGQAMVEFALVLPLAVLVAVYAAGVVALSVEVASFQKDALVDLAAGASSSAHTYQVSVALYNSSSPVPSAQVAPGQGLGMSWTHFLATGPGPRRCLAMTRGGVEFRAGVLCP